MSNELTPEQQAVIPDYEARFLKVGLQTDHPDYEKKASEAVDAFYRSINHTTPPIVIVDNIRENFFLFVALERMPESEQVPFIKSGRLVQEKDNLITEVKKLPLSEISKYSEKWGSGILEGTSLVSWSAWYAYQTEVLGKTHPGGEGLYELINNTGWVWLGEDLAIVSRLPEVLEYYHVAHNEVRIHADGKPAVRFKGDDEEDFFVYENITISEDRYKRPSSEWDPAWVLEERNADMARLVLQAVGTQKFLDSLKDKKLVHSDTLVFNSPGWQWESDLKNNTPVKVPADVEEIINEGPDNPFYSFLMYPPTTGKDRVEYKLWSFDFRGEPALALEMENPSEDNVTHFEAINPEATWVKTCKDALAWRFGIDKDGKKAVQYPFISQIA